MTWEDEFRASGPEPLTAVIAHPDRETGRTLEILLREEGFQVTVTDDPTEAEGYLATEPDLFLVDNRLPNFSLTAMARLIRQLRSERSRLDTIIVVLAHELDTKARAAGEGFITFPRPFNPLKLSDRVRQALRERTRPH